MNDNEKTNVHGASGLAGGCLADDGAEGKSRDGNGHMCTNTSCVNVCHAYRRDKYVTPCH